MPRRVARHRRPSVGRAALSEGQEPLFRQGGRSAASRRTGVPRQVFLLLLPLRGHAASSRPLGEREVAKRRLLSVREARNNKMGLLHSCKGDSSQRRSVSEPDGQPSASRRGKVPRASRRRAAAAVPACSSPASPFSSFLPWTLRHKATQAFCLAARLTLCSPARARGSNKLRCVLSPVICWISRYRHVCYLGLFRLSTLPVIRSLSSAPHTSVFLNRFVHLRARLSAGQRGARTCSQNTGLARNFNKP